MRPEAKQKFFKLLGEVMTGYGKELDPKTMEVWFAMLAPFEPATIRRAFDAYSAERPDFAPAPNGIAARCKLLDGRPEENEAWALALTSKNEQETVVWTVEMAEAFSMCRNMVEAGDEIGARMAFKDSYSRLVAEARAANRPAVWSVSAGWDNERRSIVVTKAISAGLLPAPPQHLALTDESDTEPERPEGLKRLKEAMAELEDPIVKAERISQARMEAENARTAEIAAQVRQYEDEHVTIGDRNVE